MRKISVGPIASAGGKETLHIEAPGCIVNIHAGLADAAGREVTRVSVDANADKYAGDPQWWCPDLQDPKGLGIRVVQMDKPTLHIMDSLVDELDSAFQDACVETGWNDDSQVTMLLRYIADLAQRTRFEQRTDAHEPSQTVADLKLFLEQQIEFERQAAYDMCPDESMDGDHETGLRDAGFGTDEDYGCFDGGLE